MSIEQIIIDICLAVLAYVVIGDMRDERLRVNRTFDDLIKRVERLGRDGK